MAPDTDVEGGLIRVLCIDAVSDLWVQFREGLLRLAGMREIRTTLLRSSRRQRFQRAMSDVEMAALQQVQANIVNACFQLQPLRLRLLHYATEIRGRVEVWSREVEDLLAWARGGGEEPTLGVQDGEEEEPTLEDLAKDEEAPTRKKWKSRGSAGASGSGGGGGGGGDDPPPLFWRRGGWHLGWWGWWR